MRWMSNLRTIAVAATLLTAACASPVETVSTGGAVEEVSIKDVDESLYQPDILGDLKEEFAAIVKSEGTLSAMQELHRRYRADSGVATNCHSLARHIGIITAQIGDYSPVVDNSCQYGFMHGILYGEAEEVESLETFLEEASQYCLNTYKDINVRIDCYHGVGHGLAVTSNNDIQEALSQCNSLSQYEGYEQCAGAVMMEFGEDILAEQGWYVGHSLENSPQVLTLGNKRAESLCSNQPSTCHYRLWMLFAPPRSTVRSPDAVKEVGMEAVCNVYAGDAEKLCWEGFGEMVAMLWLTQWLEEGNTWPTESQPDADAAAELIAQYCLQHPRPGDCLSGFIPSMFGHLFVAQWDYIPDVCALIPETYVAACERVEEYVIRDALTTTIE